MFRKLVPPPGSTIPFLVLLSFLAWFIISRIFTYLFPATSLVVRGIHVHHFAYGIIMLSILSFIFLAYPLNRTNRIRFAPVLGIALAFAYDEFAMWLMLDELFHDRRNFDAILVISLILLNTIYFPGFWARWGHRLWRLANILLLGLPRLLVRYYAHLTRNKS